jgi:protein gp37
LAWRLSHNPLQRGRYDGLVEAGPDGRPRWTGKVRCFEDRLDQPVHWRKPRVVFVCSQADLFHPDIFDFFRCSVLAAMQEAPQHTYLLLTKRPRVMRQFFYGLPAMHNVWSGVTVCNQAEADGKIPQLLHMPVERYGLFEAHMRPTRFWLSLEPLLGPIDLHLTSFRPWDPAPGVMQYSLPIAQVVVGAESGPHARLMNVDWVRSLQKQCEEARVPFYYKQGPGPDGRLVQAPELDGHCYLELAWRLP